MNPGGILLVGTYEYIDVAGETRSPVEGQGVASDNEVLNSVFVQQREQFSEVWLNFHGTFS